MPLRNVDKLNLKVILVHARGANYFSLHTAERLAEAIRLIGGHATLSSPTELPDETFDLGILIGLDGLASSFAPTESMDATLLAIFDRFRGQCKIFASLNLEAMRGVLYERDRRLFLKMGLDRLIDMNVHPQARAEDDPQVGYTFLRYGLLPREVDQVRRHLAIDGARPIPWACIGSLNQDRLELMQALVDEVDPRGVVYLPQPDSVRDDGRHLGPRQMPRLLAATDFYIWRSYFPSFYLEGERYRRAALHGSIPIKVVDEFPVGENPPFPYLIVPRAQLARKIRPENAVELRRRFLTEYLSWPGLPELLKDVLLEIVGGGTARRLRAA